MYLIYYVCPCVCMYVCTYICVSVCMYVCRYICMYVCLSVCMYVCVCVCKYVCKYVCMYVCLCIFMYVCMCVGMSVCMYVCLCVCMYVQTILSILPISYALFTNNTTFKVSYNNFLLLIEHFLFMHLKEIYHTLCYNYNRKQFYSRKSMIKKEKKPIDFQTSTHGR